MLHRHLPDWFLPALLVLALLIQLRQLAGPERSFLNEIVRDPQRQLARYPELRGGPAWLGRRSNLQDGAAWEDFLRTASQLIPASEAVLYVWPEALEPDLVAKYAHYQAMYSLYPRAFDLSYAEQVLSRPSWKTTKYVILYRLTPRQLPVDASMDTLYCAEDTCLYQKRGLADFP